MSVLAQGSVAQSRNPLPVAQLSIDGEPLRDAIVREVEVSEDAYSHNKATISLTYANANLDSLKEMPIFFRFGVNPSYGFFWGYIKDARKDQGFQEEVRIILTCYGYTWDMRSRNTGIWVNTPSESIAREVAHRHNLAVFFPDHWYSHPRFAQVESTDWQILNEMATLTGRVLTTRRGVIRIVNVLDALERGTVQKVLEKSINVLDPEEKPLMGFEATVGSDDSSEDQQPVFGYFASDTTVRVSEPDTAETDKVNETDIYIHNDKQARLLRETGEIVTAIDDNAEARLRGDASIGVGAVVGINTGEVGSTIVDRLDGRWFVLGVQHRIDESVFQTNLRLVRDKFRPVDSNERFEYFEGDTRAQPTLNLVNGKWSSTWK